MARPRQPLLSRDGIRDQALAIIDQDGLAALSMRKLAQELGVQAASIYTHFRNKDAVLDAVANAFAHQIDASDFGSSWQTGVRTWGTTYYAAISRHPNAAPVVAAGARDREDYLAMSDQVHGGLLEHGWPPRHATLVAASVKYLVLGAATTPFGSGFADDTEVYLGRYPHLGQAHLIHQFAEKIDHDSFHLALTCMVRGLEPVHATLVAPPVRRVAAPRPGQPTPAGRLQPSPPRSTPEHERSRADG